VLSESSVKNLDALAATVPAGSDGLVYLPYLDGERSPIFDPDSRSMFFGISKVHKKQHFMRAALEGVAFEQRSILDVLRERRGIDKMRIIGGGSNSKIWKQIIADVCNISLAGLSVPADDASSLGIAAAAGVGVGLYKDVAEGVGFITETDVVSPVQPEKYSRNYEVFSALYPATKDLMHKLTNKG
jgi:xylulokinase